jgi:hydroxyethylthiazole kinase-like uncharacterized protein yjeF
MMKIVNSQQMLDLEEATANLGVSRDQLMDNAGFAIAKLVRDILAPLTALNATILVGPGNNGSDGLVTALHLHKWGCKVTVYTASSRPTIDKRFQSVLEQGITCIYAYNDPQCNALESLLKQSNLIIDAILGVNTKYRPLNEKLSTMCALINTIRETQDGTKIISVDLPTGVYPDTGMVDPSAIKADITAALGYPKIGALNFPGRGYIGDLKVLDIGLIKCTSVENKINLRLLTSTYVSNNLPIRRQDSHKGTFGHVLVIAGSKNYVGAAVLAASGVIRSGAGLVTLATPESVYPIAASHLPEAIHLPLKEDSHGRIHPDALTDITQAMTRYNVVAVGPGLGQSHTTQRFIAQLLNAVSTTEIPIVIDADGLNNLSTIPEWWNILKSPTVITPHPGELSSLTGKSTLDIQSDRITISEKYSKLWDVTLVLKGALTVISSPNKVTSVSPFINPGLATAGTGDVLTGIIAGLIAQGSQLYPAACSGVYLHGYAGDLTTNILGMSGIIASDISNRIPTAIMSLKDTGSAKSHLPNA